MMEFPKLVSEEESTLQRNINALKLEAKELNAKLLNLKWKVKRADFVAFYEANEREELLQRIKKINEKVENYEESSSSVDNQYEKQTAVMGELKSAYDKASTELEVLRLMDQKNESAITDLNRSINVLKNRNAAMMTKLIKQKENYDNQIAQMSSLQ